MLEDNGHIYGYILNDDESAVQIADIDAKLGGAMALDYDTYKRHGKSGNRSCDDRCAKNR